ncbi:hypothetical protein A0H81_10371 [Grifola frondosa]|uniref:T6SS Phospholipase effector Tle1-like catalytic domain-containing protein n=1 Tax=Grifola frondosa TaxID=5627 RepID=A0A1C7LYW0_GRIFR|nr:hypothetical protein A0H81_10371 [Grifola frondosa]
MAQRFKKAHSRDARVHFVGIWDAPARVELIGTTQPEVYDPHVACYFRHALALDERRVRFLSVHTFLAFSGCNERREAKGSDSPPTSFSGLNAAAETAESENPEMGAEGKRKPAPPRIKEVWFSGTHSDIGSGNVENEEFNFGNPSFLWMLYEATYLRLKLNPSSAEWKWHEPHLGKGRTIRPGQKIHASVAFCTKGYIPKAQLPCEIKDNWHGLVGMGDRFDMDWTKNWNGLLELDIFDTECAVSLMNNFKDLSAREEDIAMWIHRLNMMTYTHEGRRTLGGVPGAARSLLLSIKNEWRPAMKVAVIDAVQSFAYYPIPCMKDNPPDPGLSLVLVSLLEHGPTYHNSIAMFFAKFLTERYHEIPDATLTITLLTHERENIRIECLQTIAFLVRDEHARRKMAKEWVIGLGGVLQDGSWRVRVASLDVIRVLIQSSSADEGVHNQIVDSTIWISLPAVLNHDHEDAREAGLRLIEGSLAHDIFRRAVVNEQTGDTPQTVQFVQIAER